MVGEVMADGKQQAKKGGHGRATFLIIGSIVLAVVVSVVGPTLFGEQFRPIVSVFDVGGEIFLRALQMVVVPLVMASVMSGILGLGDIRKLGRPGAYAVSYYLCTTILAVITGLIVVNIVDPGKGINRQLVEDARQEGEETIAHVAGRTEARKIRWHNVTGDRAQSQGESQNVMIPDEGAWNVRIIIDQVDDATSPAKAQLQWSIDGNEFIDVEDGEFVAGSDAGIYTTKPVIPLPTETGYARILFEPGQGGTRSIIEAYVVAGAPSIGEILRNLVLMLFTNNLLGSMVEVNLLPLIVFSILFAGMLTTLGGRTRTITDLIVSINDALMSFILLLMKLAPLGIFCLVAARFSKAQLDGQFLALLKTQAWYMTSVLSGLGIHACVTLPLLLWIFTRRNPYRFMGQMSQAILTAFSTASSTATLPVTMECAEMRAGVSRRSTEFVLPLGATINMDGTALYEAAAAIFIAQAYALVDPAFVLTFDKQVVIAVTATLAAIGAAGIPEAGLVTMLIVLNAVGLPLELIGLILPIDWLLDRFRTAVNAFGDSVGSAIVDKSFAT
jgi:Na+/H+-dicarboxylate symporter